MEKPASSKWFDLSYAMKHDEECIQARKRKWKALLILGITVCIAAASILFQYYIVAGIFGILTILNIAAALKQLQYKPKQSLPYVYTEGNPTAAIISKEKPLTVFALADLSKGNARPIYGLQRFQLQALPGHTLVPGGRIPCAAVYKDSKENAGRYLTYRIHPYCWATDKMAAVDSLERTIPKMEWRLLEDAMASFHNLEETEIIELRQDGIPLGRRNRHQEHLEQYATPEMDEVHPKVYPGVGKMIGRDMVIQIYNQFIETSALCQVYEYFCEPDPKPLMMTTFNCPIEFAKRSGRIPLVRGEVALIYFADGTLLTSLGVRRKKTFQPWKNVTFETRPSVAGKLKIYLNGRSVAVISCRKEYYTAPLTDEELRALEAKRMTRFLEKLKDVAAITEETGETKEVKEAKAAKEVEEVKEVKEVKEVPTPQ